MLPIILTTIPLVIIASTVIGVVTLLKRKKEGPVNLDFKLVFRVYYYIIMFASVVSIGIGGMFTLKSLFTNVWGKEFSYRKEYVSEEYYTKPVLEDEVVREPEYEYVKDVEKKDLISGLSYLLIATPILLLHVYGLSQLEKSDGVNWQIKKVYLIVSLVVFSMVGVISLPVGIYQTLQFFITEQADDNWTSIVPGEYLATACSFVPIWVYYLMKFNKVVLKTKD